MASHVSQRWLVTGGAGFIGSNFIRLALTERPEVAILNFDALTYAGRRENLADLESDPRYRFQQGDITAADQVEAAMAAHRPQVVVHFAAESHVDRSIQEAAPFVRTNVLGTQVLLDAARRHGVSCFLHVSTDEVYGSLGTVGRFDEDSPLAPNSPYAASKAASDLLVRAAVRTHGLAAIVIRASNTYGPYQFPEKLIPLAIAHAECGEPVPLYGTGDNVRTWLHVDDHCRGILAALERGSSGAIYNLGSDDELANRELLGRLLGLLGQPLSLIQPVPDRPGHDHRYALDCGRARRELAWAPRIALEAGLHQTVAWYHQHRPWLQAMRGREARGR